MMMTHPHQQVEEDYAADMGMTLSRDRITLLQRQCPDRSQKEKMKDDLPLLLHPELRQQEAQAPA